MGKRHTNFRTISGFTQIGSLGKTHGREGALKFFPVDEAPEELLATEFLFVDLDGSKVPFRVEWFGNAGDLLVRFADVDNPETANKFVNRLVYLPTDEVTLVPVEDDSLEYGWMKGYSLFEVSGDEIGEVLEVREFPQQEMAVVRTAGREILIPLNAEFIKAVDESENSVLLDLPEGLLDL